jgi:hypothetical protein
VALLLSRRRGRASGRLVEVVETASLGPKRQLVVARMGGELLLLASSESGVTLLSSQPAPAEGLAPAAPRTAAALVPGDLVPGDLAPAEPPAGGAAPDAAGTDADAPAPGASLPAGVARLWERLRRPAPAPEPSFDALLEETAEDLELRRKLARGIAGRVA